jgi:hypothetical protein
MFFACLFSCSVSISLLSPPLLLSSRFFSYLNFPRFSLVIVRGGGRA